MSFPTALFDLSGKVALVTGGGRGLGWEMVHVFASCGADAVIASRNADVCEAAAELVRAMGRRALAVSDRTAANRTALYNQGRVVTIAAKARSILRDGWRA